MLLPQVDAAHGEGGDAAQAASLFLLGPDGSPIADQRANLHLDGRALVLRDLVPGHYRLRMKDTGSLTMVSVLDAPIVAGVLVANTQALEPGVPRPPRIEGFSADEQSIQVKLAHATPATRVHLLARWSWSDGLPTPLGERPPKRTPVSWSPPQSLYVSGRNIGDEYRYILERRFAARQAGTMLDRPSLLLTPWSARETCERTIARLKSAGMRVRQLPVWFDIDEFPDLQRFHGLLQRGEVVAPHTESALLKLAARGVVLGQA